MTLEWTHQARVGGYVLIVRRLPNACYGWELRASGGGEVLMAGEDESLVKSKDFAEAALRSRVIKTYSIVFEPKEE